MAPFTLWLVYATLFWVCTRQFLTIALGATENGIHFTYQHNQYRHLTTDIANILFEFPACQILVVFIEQDASIGLAAMKSSPYLLSVIIPGNPYAPTEIRDQKKKRVSGVVSVKATKQQGHCLLAIYLVFDQIFFRAQFKSEDPNYLYLQQLSRYQLLENIIAPQYVVLLSSQEEFIALFNKLDDFYGAQGDIFGWITIFAFSYQKYRAEAQESEGSVELSLIMCKYCPHPGYFVEFYDSGFKNCLKIVLEMFRTVTSDGRAIQWLWIRLIDDESLWYEKNLGSFQHCPFHRNSDDQGHCTTELSGRVLHSYMTAGLNQSVNQLALTRREELGFNPYPRIGSTMDGAQAIVNAWSGMQVIPIHSFPLAEPKKSRSNLRFITSEGAYVQESFTIFYSDPYDLSVWVMILASCVTLALALSIIVSKLEAHLSTLSIFGELVSWIFGALLLQVDSTEIGDAQRPISKTVVRTNLLFFALAAFALSASYTSVMNTNYVTHVDHRTTWERLEEIQHMDLFFPLSSQLAKWLEQESRQLTRFTEIHILGKGCLSGYSKDPVNGAICRLATFIHDIIMISGGNRSCHRLATSLAIKGYNDVKLPEIVNDSQKCENRLLFFLVNITRQVQYFTYGGANESGTVDTGNIIKRSNTAMVLTEEIFDEIWSLGAELMKINSSLKLAHNYCGNCAEDTTIPADKHQLVLISGLPREFTRLLTHRAHSLIQSGMWDEWVALDTFRIARGTLIGGMDGRGEQCSSQSLQSSAMQMIFIGLVALLVGTAGAFMIKGFVTGAPWSKLLRSIKRKQKFAPSRFHRRVS